MVDALSARLGVIRCALDTLQDVHLPFTSVSVLERVPV